MKKTLLTLLALATVSVYGMSIGKVNSASKAELMGINGIGEVKAAAIIKQRKKGKFKNFGDLEKVEGVGAQLAANIKNDVKVGQTAKKVTKRKTSAKKSTSKSTKAKAGTKATKSKSKRKIKSADDKKKELKTKAKKTKAKKTKTKKTKAKKTKTKKSKTKSKK